MKVPLRLYAYLHQIRPVTRPGTRLPAARYKHWALINTARTPTAGSCLGKNKVAQAVYDSITKMWGSNNHNDDHLCIKSDGTVGIGTASPTEALDVNSDAIRIRSSQTPASATATGTAGMICWDSDYIYVCVDTNTWKRVAIATW